MRPPELIDVAEIYPRLGAHPNGLEHRRTDRPKAKLLLLRPGGRRQALASTGRRRKIPAPAPVASPRRRKGTFRWVPPPSVEAIPTEISAVRRVPATLRLIRLRALRRLILILGVLLGLAALVDGVYARMTMPNLSHEILP
jgi:hypothetical protein